MIKIRETTSEDLAHVQKLWADGDVMKFVGFPDGLHETEEQMQDWYKWISSERPLVNHYCIFDDEVYCGETFYEIDTEHDNNAALDIKLFGFARGKGIAAKALAFAIEEAFKNGAKRVWVDPNPENEKAIALYKRLGFVEKEMPAYLAEKNDMVSVYMELLKGASRRSMEVRYEDIILREMVESDIEDYVKWFTKEIEWGNWDAPWEPFNLDEATERKEWRDYYNSVKDLSEDVVRWKFEIEKDGVHVGWVSAYTDLGWMENEEEIPAIGISIPEKKYRRNGIGTKALKGFIDYWSKQGNTFIYTQTWSGNYPMIRVAEKLGFKEIARKKEHREVEGKMYDALTFRLDL